MGWKGMAIGGWVGSLFGGPLGALIGAALGHNVEKACKEGSRPKPHARVSAATDRERTLVFCASAAAMLAKMAKADGVVTKSEIAAVETAFARLGFTAEARAYAVRVFRKAKDDSHSIYEYAAEFAGAVSAVEVRELFYELLWDLACADGSLGRSEHEILRGIPRVLGINPQWYSVFASERLRGGGSGRQAPPPPNETDSLDSAYAILGVRASASDAEVKKAYREKAKKYHPDTLRAQGLPEEMASRATEMMSKVNAAWDRICQQRGIK